MGDMTSLKCHLKSGDERRDDLKQQEIRPGVTAEFSHDILLEVTLRLEVRTKSSFVHSRRLKIPIFMRKCQHKCRQLIF